MPKIHNIGPKHFVQVTNFPYQWGTKVVTRGWTQEISEPFRTSSPLIVRLPKYKALVFGKWTGYKNEEEALSIALEKREVTYDDFTEEAGWTPAPEQNREESSEDFNSRLNPMDGALYVHYWKTHNLMAEVTE